MTGAVHSLFKIPKVNKQWKCQNKTAGGKIKNSGAPLSKMTKARVLPSLFGRNIVLHKRNTELFILEGPRQANEANSREMHLICIDAQPENTAQLPGKYLLLLLATLSVAVQYRVYKGNCVTMVSHYK